MVLGPVSRLSSDEMELERYDGSLPVSRRWYRLLIGDTEDAQAAAERRRRDAHPGPGLRYFSWSSVVLGAFIPNDGGGRGTLGAPPPKTVRVLHLDFGAMRERSRFQRCSAWRFLCEAPSHHHAGGNGPVWVLRPPAGKGAGIRTADLFRQLLRRTASIPRCAALTLGDPQDARPLAWAEAMRACLDCLWVWAPTRLPSWRSSEVGIWIHREIPTLPHHNPFGAWHRRCAASPSAWCCQRTACWPRIRRSSTSCWENFAVRRQHPISRRSTSPSHQPRPGTFAATTVSGHPLSALGLPSGLHSLSFGRQPGQPSGGCGYRCRFARPTPCRWSLTQNVGFARRCHRARRRSILATCHFHPCGT